METCSLKPISSRTFINICKLKPNKRKALISTTLLIAFGFGRSQCCGGYPYFFTNFFFLFQGTFLRLSIK